MTKRWWIVLVLGGGVASCAAPGAESQCGVLQEELRQERIAREDLQKKIEFQLSQLHEDVQDISDGIKTVMIKLSEKSAPVAPVRKRPSPDPDQVYAYPVGDAPTRGPANAWVTIIEIGDYQCPFCRRVQATMAQVREQYGDQVRIAFKHNPLPFHERALPAAVAAECARDQGRFWEVHQTLFDRAPTLEDEQIVGAVRQVRQLGFKKWKRCFEGQHPKERIQADQKQAMGFGARGTPAFFINGRYLAGAQPFERFAALVDQELARAQKSGIPAASYYQKAVLDRGATGE